MSIQFRSLWDLKMNSELTHAGVQLGLQMDFACCVESMCKGLDQHDQFRLCEFRKPLLLGYMLKMGLELRRVAMVT